MNNDYRTTHYDEKRKELLLSRTESEDAPLLDMKENKQNNQKQSLLRRMMINIFKK
jgi:hypothetical protein